MDEENESDGPSRCDPGTKGSVTAKGLLELTMKTIAQETVPLDALLL